MTAPHTAGHPGDPSESDSAARRFVIAIDGPSGTGKSTVAKELARRLDAGYLDTGAMYRLVALAALRAGADPEDLEAVSTVLARLELSSPVDPDGQRHLLDGNDVTDEIRGGPVTRAVTPISAQPQVRSWLHDAQRRTARSGRMVVEGRDIGTVIVPDAELKVFLTADQAERARRRHGEIRGAAGDVGIDVEAVGADLRRRDLVDSTRATAPLRAADDAEHVDSSALTVEEVVARILSAARRRGIR